MLSTLNEFKLIEHKKEEDEDNTLSVESIKKKKTNIFIKEIEGLFTKR